MAQNERNKNKNKKKKYVYVAPNKSLFFLFLAFFTPMFHPLDNQR